MAYSYNEANNNTALQQSLKNKLSKGQKIYLYGPGITINDFMNLLGINKEQSKEELEKKQNAKFQSENVKYNVIGYSSDGSLYLATIGSENEILPYMYLRAILDDQIESLNKTQPTSMASGAIINNDIQLVKSANNINIYTYYLDTLMGQINADWYLYRNLSESETDYDYFSVRDNVEVTAYNLASIDELWVDHDIPADIDHIQDWGPEDNTSSSFQVSLPMGISWQFNTNGDVVVDEQGSQTLDYGRWELSYKFGTTAMPNPTRFEPGTEWKSWGTYAYMQIRHRATFYIFGYNTHVDSPEQLITVEHDY